MKKNTRFSNASLVESNVIDSEKDSLSSLSDQDDEELLEKTNRTPAKKRDSNIFS